MFTIPPVLLVTFNRPDLTQSVLSVVAEVQPSQLFISSDGPRDSAPNDRQLVGETRALVEKMVTWPCDLHTLFHEKNLGCRQAVLDGVDWFFGHVDEGIILEDDAVPHPDFFPFCGELLEEYRDDEKVWSILGDNSLKLKTRSGASYDFFKYALPFGAFATWKRVWETHDRDLIQWRKLRETPAVKKIWPDRVERQIHTELLDGLLDDPLELWDAQWSYSCDASGSLTIYPRANLITNMGFLREDSTHTIGTSLRANYPTAPVMPLTHPKKINRNRQAGRQALNGRMWGASKRRWYRGLQVAWRRLKNYLVSLISR